jgi:hypothetical protein
MLSSMSLMVTSVVGIWNYKFEMSSATIAAAG